MNTLEDLLKALLKLRYLTLGFTEESHKLRLVSLNAAIASARLGEQGKMFSTLTGEISDLTKGLESLVQLICKQIKELACFMADVTDNTRNLDHVHQTISIIPENNAARSHLINLRDNIQLENQNIMDSFERISEKLRNETNNLPDFIRFFNAVRVQLVVVIGGVKQSSDKSQTGDTETLRLLADSIAASCQSMETTLSKSQTMLETIHSLLHSTHAQNERVA